MSNDRRSLSFSSLFEVMPEVDRLLLGHRAVGRWTLAQICNHLTDAVIFSVEGFPSKTPWVLRRTIGPIGKKRVLGSGKFPDGVRLPKKWEPKTDLQNRAEAEALRAAMQAFGGHTDPMAEHPFFGRLTREEWERFHAIHSAHHLGFVIPDEKAIG